MRSSWTGESSDMQYDPFWSSRDLGLTWPEVKLWPWHFKVILYMIRRALTRQTRWYQIRCSIFKIKDFIVEKPFWKIFGILTPGDPNFDLSQKMTEMISKWIFASFRTLPFVFLYGDQEPRSWGGGGRSNAPPPAGGGKSRGPAGRGLRPFAPSTIQPTTSKLELPNGIQILVCSISNATCPWVSVTIIVRCWLFLFG